MVSSSGSRSTAKRISAESSELTTRSTPAGAQCGCCTEVAAANAGEDQLREIVRRAEARSPVRDAVVREVSMATEIRTAVAT